MFDDVHGRILPEHLMRNKQVVHAAAEHHCDEIDAQPAVQQAVVVHVGAVCVYSVLECAIELLYVHP